MKMHPAEIAHELKKFSFFSFFEQEQLFQFATLVQIAEFSEGDILIQQNSSNQSLFFLRKGELEVIVGGEIIARLAAVGDVVGEVTSISRRSSTATVKAKTDVEVYTVNLTDLENFKPTERDKFFHLLYKVYATVITDRLESANDKARQFEINNRELKSTKTELETINRHLETEIERRAASMRQKVKDLTTSQLMPSQVYLSYLRQIVSPDHRATVDKITRSVATAVEVLRPLSERLKTELTLQKKEALLVDPSKRLHLIAKMALGGTGVLIDAVNDANEAKALIANKKYDLFIVEANEFTALKSDIKNSKAIIITPADLTISVPLLVQNPEMENLITYEAEDRASTTRSLSTSVIRLITKEHFGLEKYLNWGVEINEYPVNKSSQRSSLIDDMRNKLKGLGVRTSVVDQCATVAEEMLMNAIYDAPVDSAGHHLYNHLPRTEVVTLPEGNHVILRYACDGMNVAVAVEDPFGSLKQKTIINYLSSILSEKAGELQTADNKAGAGRGLHQIISNSQATIFSVKRSIRTEVISLFSVHKTSEQNAHHPLINIFFTK